MARYRLRPTRPQAVVIAVTIAALVGYAIATGLGIALWWGAIGLVVGGTMLWQAFGRGRGTALDLDDHEDPPTGSPLLWGMTRERIGDGRYRVRPGKPFALVFALVAGSGIVLAARTVDGPGLVAVVILAGTAIGSTLWWAFGRNGGSAILERRD
ncbi:hypothetical protein ACPPVO_26660 [Dactylosporangium sp. McL0621]|uniref:hypothetical protein n=1 Tax=Dactylosporangium sp. McL0621 TaxID=3415678 RepID=UPI003CFA7A4C